MYAVRNNLQFLEESDACQYSRYYSTFSTQDSFANILKPFQFLFFGLHDITFFIDIYIVKGFSKNKANINS